MSELCSTIEETNIPENNFSTEIREDIPISDLNQYPAIHSVISMIEDVKESYPDTTFNYLERRVTFENFSRASRQLSKKYPHNDISKGEIIYEIGEIGQDGESIQNRFVKLGIWEPQKTSITQYVNMVKIYPFGYVWNLHTTAEDFIKVSEEFSKIAKVKRIKDFKYTTIQEQGKYELVFSNRNLYLIISVTPLLPKDYYQFRLLK